MQPEEHRINENTHVKINLKYILEVFFGKWYIGICSDVFNILLIIVYFRTINLNDGDDQILLQNSIIATLFTIGVSLVMRCAMVINAAQYYGQNLRITEADEKITFKDNKMYLTTVTIIGVVFLIPRVPILYYFIPFTKSTMCDLYGPFNCDILKAISVINLITIGILGITLFFGLLLLPTYLTGTSKDIATFVRDNIFGLLFGNVLNSIVAIVEVN